MSEFAFNNYCIVCDQLCLQSAVYCSDSCKHVDESQASSLRTNQEQLVEHLSPLLAPANATHYFEDALYTHEHVERESGATRAAEKIAHTGADLKPYDYEYMTTSPLMLLGTTTPIDMDFHTFDLNSANESNILSTSHNYRKWLTACL